MNKNKVLVLGGGITGLGAAWKLAEKGVPVEVIEAKKNEIGGLSSTIKNGPYRLDYGPHFFLSERPELVEKITGLFEEELPSFKRSAQIYFNGRFYNYPLTARNVLLQMPIRDAALSSLSYFVQLILKPFKTIFSKSNKNPSFEDWAKSSFGGYLFKLFFKPYTEQFWQIPCQELSPDSMPTNTKLSFFKTLKLLFIKDIIRSSMSLVERETTLLLRYPRRGIGAIPEKIVEQIEHFGGKVHEGWSAKRISLQPDLTFQVQAVNGLESRIYTAEKIISTIPITELVPILEPKPPEAVLESVSHLDFLSLIVVYLVINKREILKSSYLYQLATPYNRIGDMNKFCPDLCPDDENMLALEFTCHKDDKLWQSSKEELFELSINHLEKDNVLKREEVKDIFILKARHGYPIYFRDYKHYLDNILTHVNSIKNFHIVGRPGRYMYMDMDQCLQAAFDLVDEISPAPDNHSQE